MAFLNENGVERLWRHTLESYVPLTRTINDKILTQNITLSAQDVGAFPSSGGTIAGNTTIAGDAAVTGDTTIQGTLTANVVIGAVYQ